MSTDAEMIEAAAGEISRMGRGEMEQLVRRLGRIARRERAERDAMLRNLTDTQAMCTAQLLELRDARRGAANAKLTDLVAEIYAGQQRGPVSLAEMIFHVATIAGEVTKRRPDSEAARSALLSIAALAMRVVRGDEVCP